MVEIFILLLFVPVLAIALLSIAGVAFLLLWAFGLLPGESHE